MAELTITSTRQPVKPDDHSEVVPLLPIPNRTVKRLSADDSADSRVKVGHRQANYSDLKPLSLGRGFGFSGGWCARRGCAAVLRRGLSCEAPPNGAAGEAAGGEKVGQVLDKTDQSE